jgi:hypothetical protein
MIGVGCSSPRGGGGGGGSLSVGLSDASPNYGDTITITATASGITPTSYTFFLPNKNGKYQEVTQAGNTYSWFVNNIGTDDVIVTCAAGLNSIEGNTSITTILDLPLTLGKAVFGYYKMVSAYAGQWINIRRLSDNTSTDIPFLNGRGDLGAIATFVGTSAFVITREYSQVGNGDFIQTTANIQPRLMIDGQCVSLEWYGAGNARLNLAFTSGYALNETSTEYAVQRMNDQMSLNTRIFADTSNVRLVNQNNAANAVHWYDGVDRGYTGAMRISKKHLFTAQAKDADPLIRYNGVTESVTGTPSGFTAKAITNRELYGNATGGFKINTMQWCYINDAGEVSTALEDILISLYDVDV